MTTSAELESPAHRLAALAEDETLKASSRPGSGQEDAEHERDLDALLRTAGESTMLGRYVVLGTLGSGGMGTVLRAFDPKLDRRVAIKVLHRELSERQTQRLLREARALARLSHPNVVQVYEVDELKGQTFVVMELVLGSTLAEWMRATPPPSWRRCVEVFIQAGEGLAAAHEQGLVHRDFKPGNAIVDDDGRTRVLDFGLARSVRDSDDEPAVADELDAYGHDTPSSTSLTPAGTMLGTPAYMPLEQMHGRPADARSDQFSFCVSLYEAVYGERPYAGETLAELLAAMLADTVRPAPAGTRTPRALRQILLRGLASEPEERWPSMAALLIELRRLLLPRRWRALGLSAALGVGAVALGLGLAYQAEVGQRCAGAGAQLEGTWDEARRQEVRAAILDTKLPYAPVTWDRVEARLDGYAQAWTDKHVEICEATALRQEQSEEAMDLRMSCLRERRTALRAAITVLSQADEIGVEMAVLMVAGLPDLARCDDINQLLLSRQRVPPHEDPRIAREVEVLRLRLAEITAVGDAGHFAVALEQTEQLLTEAESLGYAPLLAETRLRQGQWQKLGGLYIEAEYTLTRAYTVAAEHGHDHVALGAATHLISLIGHHLVRPEEGLQWGRVALPLAKYAGDSTEVARIKGMLGSVSIRQGDYKNAEARYREALELLAHTTSDNLPIVAQTMDGLGAALDLQGQYDDAERYYREALRLRTQALGAEHPYSAASMDGLGTALMRRGKSSEAEDLFRRSLDIRERTLGPEHPNVAKGVNNLGTALHMQERYEEAEQLHRRALRIRQRTQGADHPSAGRSANNLGDTLLRQGKYEDAEEYTRQAVRIFESALGDNHPDLVMSLSNLGRILYFQARYEEAQPLMQRSLQLGETVLGKTHAVLAEPLIGLAMVDWSRQDFDGAREHAERAVAVSEQGNADPKTLGEARVHLARVLWLDPAERSRAVALVQRARDAGIEQLAGEHGRPVVLEQWLAEHRIP